MELGIRQMNMNTGDGAASHLRVEAKCHGSNMFD